MSTKVVEIKTLKVGKYIVLGGEACKIISYTTSSPGKHGAAKARIEAVGIFDNLGHCHTYFGSAFAVVIFN